ncbi:MAG TPA: glycosyltransferase family 39 protein [Nitrososphaeraceae archaeon]|nr:glycosyltransferase family 39 protein [Nitrososphaeraceae archaeon]
MNKQEFVELINSTKFLLGIVLILAAFTHLWNASQFPGTHIDEGHYIRRALHVLSGLGPQENSSNYDHPFMGQIVLAQLFGIIGYPNSLNPSTSVESIEALYAVPRIFMGIFSIIDTFLVFMIGRYCYNKNVGLVASLLFAVMPMSWQLRRVVLDSIQLPFVLSSILLAFLIKEHLTNYGHKKITLIILLSGIFLGLAIFTKIPAIFIIPFVSYLIIKYSRNKIKYSNEDHKQKNYTLKNLGIWFIPVILIPLIWPAYAIYLGDFDKWVDGVAHQAAGRGSRLSGLWESFIYIDPLLLSLAVGGTIFSLIRKDFFPILWIAPFVLFVLVNQWFLSFHWNLLLPAFCIYGGAFLVELPNSIKSIKLRKYVHVTVIGIVSAFGFVSIILLISVNISTGIFQASATTVQYLNSQLADNKTVDQYSIISSPTYTWLFKYPFGINNTLNFRDSASIKTPNIILVIDGSFQGFIGPYEKILHPNVTQILDDNNLKSRVVGRTLGTWIRIDLGTEKMICGMKLWWYKGDSRSYNFTLSASNDSAIFTEIASYHSNGKTVSEEYGSNNKHARYVGIHFNGNTDNNIGSISEIALYGINNVSNSGECSKLEPKSILLSNDSYIESGVDKRIEQIAQIIPQTKVISKISLPKEYDPHVYPFTNMKYTGMPSIEIRAK